MTKEEVNTTEEVKEVKKTTKKADVGFVVNDIPDLEPKSLPLVVTPTGGGWKNANQEAFAKVVNGYAYKNPKKFAEKKDDRKVNGKVIKGLLTRLQEIGDNPELYPLGRDSVSYTNKLIGGDE